MLSVKKLKKTLKSMKRFITTFARGGERGRSTKQELKEAKRRKLEERNSLIGRESSLSQISVAASVRGCECAAAFSSGQANCSSCSSPAQDSLQRIDSDEFFAQILNENGSSSSERSLSFDPFVNYDPFTGPPETWINFDSFSPLDSNEMITTLLTERLEKEQSIDISTDNNELPYFWSPSSSTTAGAVVSTTQFSIQEDLLPCPEKPVEMVFFSESDDLLPMIPRSEDIIFLPLGSITNDIMELSQAPQELSETEKLLPTILLTPPDEMIDQPPQVLFEGNVSTKLHPVAVEESDKQVSVSRCSCNPLLELLEDAFADKLFSQKILLESCAPTDSPNSLISHVRVANLGFVKNVLAHMSTDDWSTASDIRAEYESSSHCFTTDRFCLELPATSTLEFALCYEVNGQKYWDNNNGRNYFVRL